MKIIREHINEKFEQDSDPIRNMNIGRIRMIKDWLDKMVIKNYEILDDFSIDVFEDVDLTRKLNGNLPEYIQFNSIFRKCNVPGSGKFLCEYNDMTTLRGCPKFVNWYFSCANNKLTSLEYSPKKTKNFYCYNNAVKFTPKDVLDVCDVEITIFTTSTRDFNWERK